MPSFKSKLLSGTIRSVKPLLTGINIPGQRKGMDLLRYIHPKPKSVRMEKAKDAPLAGVWAIPEHPEEGKAILYSHGGSYVSGSPSTHEAIIARLAEQCSLPVFAYDYRLAPEHPFPAALEDACAAVDYLAGRGYPPERLAFCGDSAGGGLTLALTMMLRDQGRGLPAALAVLSPWADLTETSDSHFEKDDSDPILSSEELRNTAPLYAGKEDLRHPYISPLFGDFTGFPPTLIQVGTNEILLDDSLGLAKKMEAQNVEVDIDVFDGMWHVWHSFDIPEAHTAIRKIARFVDTALEVNGLKKRTVRPGTVYRHFKGNEYRVLEVARHSETLEKMVVYQQLYGDHSIWVRPLDMFLEITERDGRRQPRFKEVEEPSANTQEDRL